MKIWYDDIIYSLQKAGGISVVWSNITKDVPFDAYHIRYTGFDKNPFSQTVSSHKYEILSSSFLALKRFINPQIPEETQPFLFHSSYFRYCKNSLAINVTTIHDFVYEYYNKRLRGKAHIIQKKHAIMHSDGIICISENTKNDLEKFYPEYNGLIKVIHNGYNADKYYLEPSKKEKIVLFIGSRVDYKRFDITVAIVKALPECKLIIVGGGELTSYELTRLENEIHDRYEQLGYISDDELRCLYNKAFFLSYCSDYEGFGIPPIEAQACGCPVVCQAKSSLPEVVSDTAIYIDPNKIPESIITIKKLYDNDFYNSIVSKGFQNVKRFSWNKCRHEVINFYREILDSKGLRYE